MNIYDSANALANEIRQSALRQEYDRLHNEVMGDETTRALLKEYKRLQMVIQMKTMSGAHATPEDTARFAQLSSLLYMSADIQAYLLAEMNLQKAMADVIKLLTDAAGIQLDVFG